MSLLERRSKGKGDNCMHVRQTGRRRRLPLLVAAVVSAILSIVLIVVLVILAVLFAPPLFFDPAVEVDPGVGLATAGLALFTGLLFLAAATTAYFAYTEISRSTAANSADLALQMDNRFNSDRALRIRHGAVTFLATHQRDSNGNGQLKRNLDLRCYHEISPYDTDQEFWCGLNSDLIDLFNYFDWIGYLADGNKAIDREVVAQKFGPWIIMYYQICRDELALVRRRYPARWRYLTSLYERLIQREKDWYEELGGTYPGDRTPEEIANFLQREHVRSHRGFNPGSNVNVPGSEAPLSSEPSPP